MTLTMYKYQFLSCFLFSTQKVESLNMLNAAKHVTKAANMEMAKIYQNFSASCISKSGELFGKSEICIPIEYLYGIGYAPTPEDGCKNEIEIEMTNIQIIEIDDKLRQMSLIMHLNVEWADNRVRLVRPYTPIILNNHDKKRIWSPEFIIATNLVAQIKNGLEEDATLYGFQKDLDYKTNKLITGGFSHSDFRATVFCEMNFGHFPFDIQICEFKVCTYVLFICKYLLLHTLSLIYYLVRNRLHRFIHGVLITSSLSFMLHIAPINILTCSGIKDSSNFVLDKIAILRDGIT